MDNNWNGQTWNGQSGYNGQNQQQPLYQYNKPVETLESIRHKFNSTAKWLKAMGIISQILMCCAYGVWVWTTIHSPAWTETYENDYGISGMAKLYIIFMGLYGLILLITVLVGLAMPLFVCQIMYNKPGQRPSEKVIKVLSIISLVLSILCCELDYWIAVPTLIITVILQFRATSLRTKMERIYIQQTGQNMTMTGQNITMTGQNMTMTGQNMNNMGQSMGGQVGYGQNPVSYVQNSFSYGQNPVSYGQNPVYDNVKNNQYTQEQRDQDQPDKNNNTVSEKVTSNQENINTETNKEQIQPDQTESTENNEENFEKSRDQEKPETKATENGGESIG